MTQIKTYRVEYEKSGRCIVSVFLVAWVRIVKSELPEEKNSPGCIYTRG